MPSARRFWFLLLLSLLGMVASLRAAEWQWSVEMAGVVSLETGRAPRAFLWIPPDCQRVRGVVLAQHALAEEALLEHPSFRAALKASGLAAVWVTPAFDPVFRFDAGAGERVEALLKRLAQESGYLELEHAPILPVGHAGASSFPWNFAAWNPDRTIAVVSISGQWPYPGGEALPAWGDRSVEGVPGLVTLGEYEYADDRVAEGIKLRADYPQLPLSFLGETGGGYFDLSEEKIAAVALYVRKAAQYRLPADGPLNAPVTLKEIDPEKAGWLADRWRVNEPTRVQAGPVAEYAEPDDAFWFFDEEMAVAAEKFSTAQRGKRVALTGFVQNGVLVPQVSSTPQQVTIPFVPTGDGITFKLSGAFLDRVPEGRPERWTGLKAGSALPHPDGTTPVAIERIAGPVEKLGADTFALHFDRVGFDNPARSAEVWLAATHPGDRSYKRSVQQGVLYFPLRNTEGAEQKITFAPIPAQRAGTKSLALSAQSSAADAKVRYYVREGPAEIDGDTLVFTPIPPRSRFPIKVTVVAWQWGRMTDPKLKTAEPVERTFVIEAP